MSFVASFSITPTANASTFVLQDTSVGSDSGLTDRQVLLYQVDGTLLVPAINWPISNNTISIDVLTTDIALNIVTNWISSSPLPPPSTYTDSKIFAFVKYGQQFVYSLTQQQQSQPNVVQTTSWYNAKLTIICEILSAQNAIDEGEDVYGAEQCIVRYNYIIANQNDYFANGSN